MLDYREFAPLPLLSPAVDRLWTLAGDASDLREQMQPVLPDGRPELVLHLGDRFERLDPDGSISLQPAVLFAGQLRQRLLLRPTGSIAVLGVRFHPFGAAAFFRVPQHHFAGDTPGVDVVSAPLSRDLASVRARTTDLVEAAALVQQVLARHMDATRIDPRVRWASYVLTRGGQGVDAVAQRVGLTRRHLERRFLEQVGIPPKRLARIARFSRAVSLLEASGAARESLASAACGYADQPHFIREFRELAGCAPGEHLLRRAEFTGFFVPRTGASF